LEVLMASMDVPADRPARVPPANVVVAKPAYITWLTLAFMTTASVAELKQLKPSCDGVLGGE
jgi:glutamate:GABA antiporter